MGPPVLVQPRRKSIAMFGGGPLRTIVQPSTREPLRIDMDRLRPYLHLPQKLAAAHLGLSLTALKSTCRKLGIGSWAQARAEDAARSPAAQKCNKPVPETQIAQMHETSCTSATATSDASAAAAAAAHTALPTKAFVVNCKPSIKSLEECGLDPDLHDCNALASSCTSWTAWTSILDPVRSPSPRTTSRASSTSLYSADTTLNATVQTARPCYKSVHGAGFQRVAESHLIDARLAGWRQAQEKRARKTRKIESDDLLDPPKHSRDRDAADAACNLVPATASGTASRPAFQDLNDMRASFAEPFLHDLPRLPDDGMALNTEQATRCHVDCDFSEAAGSGREVPDDDNKTHQDLLQENSVDVCLVRLLQLHASSVDPDDLAFGSADLSFLVAASAGNPRQDQRGDSLTDRRPQQAAHSSL